ncbi:hypothetical protein [Streptomyces sp. NPDC001678]|uniref:hypothetical protein n=1 Tax=Streptomyces sp. NPDC001678 TaxID=3364599 RepID=UPI0036944F97
MPGQVRSTEQERLERLRALLSGARSKDRVGGALGQGGYGNVLIGAMLHGADRVRQGHTPTDLERVLLDALGTVVSSTEAQQWGRAYREALTGQGGRLPVVPETITRRSVNQGYTMADLRQDLPQIVNEALSCPNVQIVDPYTTAAGQGEDPAFIEAMRESGFAVTGFARPTASKTISAAAEDGTGQAQESVDGQYEGEGKSRAVQPFRVRLELESFFVRRAVGDQWGGRDEIYWTASTATGTGAGTRFDSGEFGRLKTGDTRSFYPEAKVLFDGTTKGYLGTSIQCWEADQSSDAWWAELRKRLDAAIIIIDAAMTIADSGIGVVPMWVSTSWEIAKMFIFIIDAFRNYDDLSCQRSIVMDQQDLAVLAHYGQTTWHFNGDGYHELRVKYTGPPVPIATGTLECVVRNGASWGAPIVLDWESLTPPALATYNNKLYALFVRPSDRAVMWSRLEPTTGSGLDGREVWATPQRIGTDASIHAPAVAAAHGKLYYAVTGQDGGLYWRTYTEAGGWSPAARFPQYVARYSPALASQGNELWLVHANDGGKLWLTVHHGSTWAAPFADNLNWTVTTGPALCSNAVNMWRIVTGSDQKVYTSRWSPQWAPMHTLDPWRTRNAPALVFHDGKMQLFMRGLDGALYTSTFTAHVDTWSAAQKINGPKPQDEPSAASHHGKLYLMYRR